MDISDPYMYLMNFGVAAVVLVIILRWFKAGMDTQERRFDRMFDILVQLSDKKQDLEQKKINVIEDQTKATMELIQFLKNNEKKQT